MTLHPLATHFSTVAGAYERGRREYAPSAVGALTAELGVPAGAAVLDLAAGTGKLTRALLAQGYDVLAVEPLAAFREVLAESVGAERVRDGVAEAIPLEAGAVAAVTVADAFHWFDQAAALTEIRRVLRPGGGLALLSTVPDWSGCSWAHEVGELIMRARPEHPHFDGPSWRDAVQAADGFGEPREIQVITSQPAQPERMADFLSSMSWVAAMSEAERADLLGRITILVDAGETPAEVPVRVVIGLTSLSAPPA